MCIVFAKVHQLQIPQHLPIRVVVATALALLVAITAISLLLTQLQIKPTVLSDGFSRDDGHVYWAGAAIQGADPATFSVLKYDDYLDEGYKFSRDAKHVYFSTVDAAPEEATWPIPDTDPTTFHILGETNSGAIYAADKYHVFEGPGVVVGADATTFHLVLNGLKFDAVDASHRYLRGSQL